jgi:hypothetical protein
VEERRKGLKVSGSVVAILASRVARACPAVSRSFSAGTSRIIFSSLLKNPRTNETQAW